MFKEMLLHINYIVNAYRMVVLEGKIKKNSFYLSQCWSERNHQKAAIDLPLEL